MKTIVALLFTISAIFMANHFTTEIDAEKFQTYLDSFEKKELPYVMDESNFFYPEDRKIAKEKPSRKQLEKLRNENIISGEALDFLPFRQPIYSRMGPDEYTYEAELALSDEYKAVIVGGMRPFGGNHPYYYTLITYDLEGNVISSQEVAQSYGKRNIQRCSIFPNGEIRIEHTKNEVFEDDIVSTEVSKVEEFTISPSGEIKPIESLIRKVMPEVQQTTPMVKTARASIF